MSVRAYLIKSNEYESLPNGDHKSINTIAGNPTFNCWHDWSLIEGIADVERYNDGGIIYIERESVIERLAELEQELIDQTLDNETRKEVNEWIEICKDILADIKLTGESYAEYDCY